jgi:undecaprenyl diphosphate synthase
MEMANDAGIQEITAYGFTKENVRRPSAQIDAFRAACVEFSRQAIERGAALRIIGDASSPVFPPELSAYTRERSPGRIRANLLVNYGWQWDIDQALNGRNRARRPRSVRALGSADVSRIDLVVRWGGRHRLSGFLPLQCAYSDFFSVDTLWPDMCPAEFEQALEWYSQQDVTLGG